MATTRVSECGRFVVVDDLHLDRNVLEALARWATERGLRLQDAIQLALCAFNDGGGERDIGTSQRTAFRVQDSSSPDYLGRLE